MSVTAHEQKILTFTDGSTLTHEKQRECKKECKGWTSDPAQAGTGPAGSYKVQYSAQNICWCQILPLLTREPSSERVYHSPLFANVSLFTPSWPTCRWSEWGQRWGTTHNVTDTFSRTLWPSISISMHLQLPILHINLWCNARTELLPISRAATQLPQDHNLPTAAGHSQKTPNKRALTGRLWPIN